MRPAFAGNAVATTLIVATFAFWAVIELRQALNRRPGATVTDSGSLVLVRLVTLAAAVLAGFALRVQAASFGYHAWVIAISLALMWSGIALRLWSFHALGKYFTFQVMTSADQEVITAGPYRFLRHPSYTGILLVLIGFGLSYGNWMSLAGLGLSSLLVMLYRIRVEEAALSSAMPDRYASYARGRKRLVPFVW